jgi:hypothetical protein
MPQASGSLSQEQRSTLTSVYTFAHGSVLYLEAALARVRPEDELHLGNLIRFGRRPSREGNPRKHKSGTRRCLHHRHAPNQINLQGRLTWLQKL